MKEKRTVYNGYEEAYLTGLELKNKYENSYFGTYRHHSTFLALTIPQYLNFLNIQDNKKYRVFYNNYFCKIMREDTDGQIAFFSHATPEKIKLNHNYHDYQLEILCPECGEKMNLKTGKFGFFLGCSAYPKCKHTSNIPIIGNYLSESSFSE